MTVEMEMMNEENGRLRRHIKTLEVELKKAAQAGTKTVDRNIRVTDAVEPFKPLSDDEILWIAQSHGIDVYACNVLGFYTDLITSPVQAAVAAVHKATGSKKC